MWLVLKHTIYIINQINHTNHRYYCTHALKCDSLTLYA